MKQSDAIKIRLLRIMGFAYFLLGAIAILHSSRTITGFSIFDGISGSTGIVLGVVLIFIGIFILLSTRRIKNEAI